MSTIASTSSSASSPPSSAHDESPPSSPYASSSSESFDPNEPFQAPLGAEIDRDPSIDGTNIGAGSAYAGSSDLGSDGLRKSKLEDIDQGERAVSPQVRSIGIHNLYRRDVFAVLGSAIYQIGSEQALQQFQIPGRIAALHAFIK